ncbi:MAG: hypothetical protein ACI38A_07770 [Candidatus Ornithomonoglobus sp.]
MTLLITVFAAIVCTVLWYNTSADNDMKLGTLCLMYWGAALMWFVDAVVEYIEEGSAYFTPTAADMLNNAFLGLSAVAFGLVIWLIIVLIKDPKGRIRDVLTK